MKGDKILLNKDLWSSKSWLTECAWTYECETIHRTFHVNTDVWASPSWATWLLLCSECLKPETVDFGAMPQLAPTLAKTNSCKVTKQVFFWRGPCSAPCNAHRSFACIGHNIGTAERNKNIDQEPLEIDQEPLEVDQTVDQEPVEVDQEPLSCRQLLLGGVSPYDLHVALYDVPQPLMICQGCTLWSTLKTLLSVERNVVPHATRTAASLALVTTSGQQKETKT